MDNSMTIEWSGTGWGTGDGGRDGGGGGTLGTDRHWLCTHTTLSLSHQPVHSHLLFFLTGLFRKHPHPLTCSSTYFLLPYGEKQNMTATTYPAPVSRCVAAAFPTAARFVTCLLPISPQTKQAEKTPATYLPITYHALLFLPPTPPPPPHPTTPTTTTYPHLPTTTTCPHLPLHHSSLGSSGCWVPGCCCSVSVGWDIYGLPATFLVSQPYFATRRRCGTDCVSC